MAVSSRGHALLLAGLLAFACPVLAQGRRTLGDAGPDLSEIRPRATLTDVGLLIGHWRGEFLGGAAELVWLPPAGGAMVGVFRLLRRDEVVFYELLTAVEADGGVSLRLKHFHPDMKGWEERDDTVSFRLIRTDPDAVWFEGLSYRRQPDGSLKGVLDIRSRDGRVRKEGFTLKPVTGR
ncbi:MAG: hypothetical protein IT186_15860 [Acidobacteria bacterium]|nr:hypothetical protein [Acidobacteriota bacterium]